MTTDLDEGLELEVQNTRKEQPANTQLPLQCNTIDSSFGSQSPTHFQPTNKSNATSIQQSRKAAKSSVGLRKVWRFLGFHKAYNFALFVFSAGAMLGFTLARIPTLNISGSAASSLRNSASPGEWYYFHTGHYRVGITLHLVTIIPAGLLMVPQFVPVVRHRFPFFHFINGYLVMILVFFGNIGAFMIARRAFGGGLDAQAAVGALVIFSTIAISLSHYNIKRLQIDQHRAWILRAMFYVGVIITARVIQAIAALIISHMKDYYQIQTCGEVGSDYRPIPPPRVAAMYYQCLNASSDTNVIVNAHHNGQPEQVGAGLGLSFGMAMWVAILLHFVGVEIYLNLTPSESHRLREVSYERQMEAGFQKPGSAGLTADRWGDAPAWESRRSASTRPIVDD